MSDFPSCSRTDCISCKNGVCIILYDNNFKRPCPFFCTKEESMTKRVQTLPTPQRETHASNGKTPEEEFVYVFRYNSKMSIRQAQEVFERLKLNLPKGSDVMAIPDTTSLNALSRRELLLLKETIQQKIDRLSV